MTDADIQRDYGDRVCLREASLCQRR